MDDWDYIANVRVTGFDAAGSVGGAKEKPVHGHAVSHSLTDNNWEHHRHFLWVAFGAPRDTELTVNVDGVSRDVTTTSQGKVKSKGCGSRPPPGGSKNQNHQSPCFFCDGGAFFILGSGEGITPEGGRGDRI